MIDITGYLYDGSHGAAAGTDQQDVVRRAVFQPGANRHLGSPTKGDTLVLEEKTAVGPFTFSPGRAVDQGQRTAHLLEIDAGPLAPQSR